MSTIVHTIEEELYNDCSILLSESTRTTCEHRDVMIDIEKNMIQLQTELCNKRIIKNRCKSLYDIFQDDKQMLYAELRTLLYTNNVESDNFRKQKEYIEGELKNKNLINEAARCVEILSENMLITEKFDDMFHTVCDTPVDVLTSRMNEEVACSNESIKTMSEYYKYVETLNTLIFKHNNNVISRRSRIIILNNSLHTFDNHQSDTHDKILNVKAVIKQLKCDISSKQEELEIQTKLYKDSEKQTIKYTKLVEILRSTINVDV